MEQALDVASEENNAHKAPAQALFKYLNFSKLGDFLKKYPKSFTTIDVFFC